MLVTIVVGIAVAVAIDTMEEAFTESNRNALRQDMLMVINDAKLYYNKPVVLGGGGNSFNGITEEHIQSIDPQNDNGSYLISGSGDSVTVEGTSNTKEIALSVTAIATSGKLDISWTESTKE